MKTRQILLSLAVCLIASAGVYAQEFLAGDNTFTISGSGASDNDFDYTAFGAEFSLGHFFTKSLEGKVRQGLSVLDSPGGNNDWDAATRVALDYFLYSRSLCPFVGVSAGYIYGDNVSDTWVGGPEGGLKLFLNETTYVLGLIEYEFFFDKGDSISDRFEDGRFVYTLGIGLKF